MSIEAKITMAQQSAERWLKLIDRSKYSNSWLETASYFQNNITQNEWDKTLQGVRQPLGKIISREIAVKQYTSSLPGCPDGEYVVIQFKTSFERKKTAIETVTPMLDRDSEWKVAGYFIN